MSLIRISLGTNFNMKNKSLFFLAIFFIACSSPRPESSAEGDSSGVSISTGQNSTKKFPLFLNESTLKDSFPLPIEFLNSYIIPQKNFMDENWIISDFMKIDSIKRSGKYKNYVENLDIGQTKDATTWVYDTLSFAKGKIFIWGISYYSFEACPSFAGRIIYLTSLTKEGSHLSTYKLLENSGGMDAPIYGTRVSQCIMNEDLSISCKDTVMNGESMMENDKSFEETRTVTSLRKLQIDPNGKINLIENKESPEIIERKKAKE